VRLKFRPVAGLQGVMSSFDWYLDRVSFISTDPTRSTVDHDIVRATTDLHSDRLVRELESCRHLHPFLCQAIGRSAHLPSIVYLPSPGAVASGVAQFAGWWDDRAE